MAQLWGGRFTKETDQLVYNFNASITFDKRFYKQDIRGSLAHVAMLAKQGIIEEQEKEEILKGRQFKDVIILDTAGVSSMYACDGGIIISY